MACKMQKTSQFAIKFQIVVGLLVNVVSCCMSMPIKRKEKKYMEGDIGATEL